MHSFHFIPCLIGLLTISTNKFLINWSTCLLFYLPWTLMLCFFSTWLPNTLNVCAFIKEWTVVDIQFTSIFLCSFDAWVKTGGKLLCQPNSLSNKQLEEYLRKLNHVKSNASPYKRTHAASSELPSTGIKKPGDSCYTGLDAKFQLKSNRYGGSASCQTEDILCLSLSHSTVALQVAVLCEWRETCFIFQ